MADAAEPDARVPAAAAVGTEIKVDADEIAEANWYSREELAAAVASGDLLLPPPVSIAHRIIQSWYGSRAARQLVTGPQVLTPHRSRKCTRQFP